MAQSRRHRSTPTVTPAEAAATKQAGIRLPVPLTNRLLAIARAEGNNLSSVVRRLLVERLADTDEAA